MGKYKDISNERFGWATAISYAYTDKNSHRAMWNCICDCGNQFIASGAHLRSGTTKSCGCYRQQCAREKADKKRIDLIGQQFGMLTVINYAGPDTDHGALWTCQCDCGSVITTRGNALRNENVISCGCVKSKGEYQLAQLLTQYNINFIHDRAYFNDLLSPKQQALRYDFILLNKDIPYGLIEYDGLQHTQHIEFFDETITDWQYRKLCDDIKTNYAEIHRLPLLRISTINEQELKNWLIKIKDIL